jgi:hypothetical protein
MDPNKKLKTTNYNGGNIQVAVAIEPTIGTNIYVIYHSELEDVNIFTTIENQVPVIIEHMLTKYKDYGGEWKYRLLQENVPFCADMTCF